MYTFPCSAYTPVYFHVHHRGRAVALPAPNPVEPEERAQVNGASSNIFQLLLVGPALARSTSPELARVMMIPRGCQGRTEGWSEN